MYKISNKELLELFRVMTWLDEARWDNLPVIKNPSYEALPPEQRLLVHWLCYITDRQRPYRQVWDKGGQIFSTIVNDYTSKRFPILPEGTIKSFLNNYRDMKSDKKVKPFVSVDEGKSITYTPRYGSDLKSIIRTLTILLKYDKNFAQFIDKQIRLWKEEDEPLVHVAYALDLLTYRNKISIQKANELLTSKEKFQRNLKKWNRTKGHKRLWAALRDYRKPGGLFFKDLKEALDPELASVWASDRFPLNQLELPGDIWNERMNKNLVINLAEKAGIEVKRRKNYKESPLIARLIYEKIKTKNSKYYPERLDVSFDFAPRMCDRCNEGMYKVCPFGEGSSKICYKEKENGEEKYCPVTLITCGYLKNCDPEGCPILEHIGKGLCRRIV